jgi:peptidoglycan hydrolase-like protein with peptidoglycan-binding domain
LKLISLAAIFPALVLAGCSDPPDPPPAFPSQTPALLPGTGQGVGIDMATDASDVAYELKDANVEFVARYYRDPNSRWPPLSPSEAQHLSALGLKIVAVYEYHSPRRAHFTYEWGYSDALTAYGEARAVGQPIGSAIYFAADFHARYYDLASVVDYFRGVHAGLTTAGAGAEVYAIGVYGSAPVCNAVRTAGLARYSWLSNSITWDDGADYEDWNIMQGASLPGLSVNNDSDQARSNYGAFEVAPSAPVIMPVSIPMATSNPE